MYYVYLDPDGRYMLSEKKISNKILLYSVPVKSAAENYVRRKNLEIEAKEKTL